MGDKFKDFENIAILVLIGGGLFIAYSIWQDIKNSEIIDDIVDPFVVPDDKTLSCGERCVNNSQCSSTGIHGGKSVGVDLFGQQQFGCCGGFCKNKVKLGVLNLCPGPGANACEPDMDLIDIREPERTHPLGGECDKDEECSDNGLRNGPPGGKNIKCFANPPSKIPKCNRISDDKRPKKMEIVDIRDLNTRGLGGDCKITPDCSATEVYGGPPSDGKYTECRLNVCSRTKSSVQNTESIIPIITENLSDLIPKWDTRPLGGKCLLTSDCSETGFRDGHPSDGTFTLCKVGRCNIK